MGKRHRWIDPNGLCSHTVYTADDNANVHVDCLDPTGGGGGGGGGGGVDSFTLCALYGICPGGLPTPLPGPDGGGGGGGGGGEGGNGGEQRPNGKPEPKS